MKRLRPIAPRFFAALLLVTLAVIGAAPAPAQNSELLRHTLREHGVATTPLGLGRFLVQGWKGAEVPKILPASPAEKSTLLYQAWVLLTLEYEEVAKNPELFKQIGILSRHYATGDLPEGARQIIAEDLRSLDPTLRQRGERMLTELLQYNGMVALGYFGAATDENLKAARAVYAKAEAPAVRVAYAQTLGMLGDASVVGDLVQIAGRGDRGASVQAARTLELLTGRVFSLDAQLAVGPRREAAGRIVAWYDEQEQEVPLLQRDDMIFRLLNPPPQRRPALSSLRDLLRAASDKTDMTDERGSRTAWRRLEERGEKLADDLEPILKNVDEDLDIRAEAIRWYLRLKGEGGAKKQLKKLRGDPNPEIAALATSLLEGGN